MKKLLPILRWVLVVVLLVVGLALIFNEQIKSYVVHNMSQSAISQPVSKKKSKGNFDFQSVKAVDIKGVAAQRKIIQAQLEKLQFQVSD
nr:hypothetical protein [Ligilactobacillus hayakitensis]